MKKVIYPLLLLLLTTIVVAGEIRKIDLEKDLGDKNGLILEVTSGDAIEFDMFDGRHIVTIDKIHQKGVDLDVFLFANRGEDQKVSYMTVSPKRTVKLDFDKDGIGDLYIGFKEFLSEDTAKIIFYNPNIETIQEDNNMEEITGEIIARTPKASNYIHLFFGLTILVLILLVVFFSISEKKKAV
ncbi:MAG: hypothetical protein ABIB47_06845 [Candidatus Woesearchaeota archaeon]